MGAFRADKLDYNTHGDKLLGEICITGFRLEYSILDAKWGLQIC
ncbi:MAG: hypothetical protein ANABAC_1550 [Anaerolineae bacterium]|nr:MAG: hypothetical protein ANABAC_1550 [Anaerolineae bacterium]